MNSRKLLQNNTFPSSKDLIRVEKLFKNKNKQKTELEK